MMKYARAEKQREHQPSFRTVRESVQFSAVGKKPMRFYDPYVDNPGDCRGKYRNKIPLDGLIRLFIRFFCASFRFGAVFASGMDRGPPVRTEGCGGSLRVGAGPSRPSGGVVAGAADAAARRRSDRNDSRRRGLSGLRVPAASAAKTEINFRNRPGFCFILYFCSSE